MSRPGGWFLWLVISFFGGVLPFILIPVYINFMSRIMLAWGLDRQVPSWFCAISERVRAPLNAILTLVGISAVLVVFENFSFLPASVAAGGKLNLAGLGLVQRAVRAAGLAHAGHQRDGCPLHPS